MNDELERKYELVEHVQEIVRHHKAFKEISDLCTEYYEGLITADQALLKIRNIVG